jgi:thiol-disulfide isomerase/thioredoxin
MIEVQAVRIYLALTAAALCLSLAGCQTSRQGRGGAAQPTSGGRGQVPFVGTPVGPAATASAPAAADRGNLASGGSPNKGRGVLAGRVLDADSRIRPGTIIQVLDLESSRDGGAPLSVMADREGYFDITDLEAGRSYRLIAKVKDAGKVYSGSARVVPPNVRIAIWLTDESPAEPQTADAGPAAAPEGKQSTPAASLGPPVKNPSAGVTTPTPGAEAPGTTSVPPVSTSDPSLIATEREAAVKDGVKREAPPVSVPNAPGRTLPGRDYTPEKQETPLVPPPPPNSTPPEERPVAPPTAAPPSETAKADIPRTSTMVPSCRRVGLRVENLALYDSRGEVFELEKDRRGKVVLLDLWYTGCPPCLRAIPRLTALQSKYGQYGLEVIGITYERGTLAEKQASLEAARAKYRLAFNYRLLFGGGGSGPCPVAEQLEVRNFPTLVLLDETGKILYRCQGLDEQSHYELEMAIRQKLFPGRAAGR